MVMSGQHAFALTLPIQPSEEHRNRARVQTKAVAGTFDQPQFGRAVGLGQLSCVDSGDAVVVIAVHDQKRSRGQPPSSVDRAEASELTSPLVERRRKAWCADGANVTGVLQE